MQKKFYDTPISVLVFIQSLVLLEYRHFSYVLSVAAFTIPTELVVVTEI